MSIDTRLSRLAPALTAQERAILILEAWKDGREEDPSWRQSMPQEQIKAFNRYIDLINGANPVLGHLITGLHAQAEKLQLREAWLFSLTLWEEHIDEIRRTVNLWLQEPIAQSEYDAKLAAAREEWVHLEEIAAFLAGYRDDWREDDYEQTEDGRELTDAAWDRAVAEESKKLRALVVQGTLPGRGKGKALKLRADSVCHFGHEVSAVSEHFLSYRVVPDDQAEGVALERDGLRRLQNALDWQTHFGQISPEIGSMPEQMRTGVRESMAFQLISAWVELRSIDVALDEIGEQFNGVDPLKPVLREKIEATREKLRKLKENLLVFDVEVELREPLEEELQEIRDFVASFPSP